MDLGVDQNLETAVDHALRVEGHRLRIHHVSQARVFHYLRVDTIAMRARFKYDPRKHHRLTGFELDALGEGRALSRFYVVGDAFPELEGAVLEPDLARLLGNAAIGPQVFLRDGQDKSIDVLHLKPP